jgi:hypothetical protein
MPPPPMRKCNVCRTVRAMSHFQPSAHGRRGAESTCRSCKSDLVHIALRDHRVRMWRAARDRSRESGMQFNIWPKDIELPDVCPFFDVPIEYTRPRLATPDGQGKDVPDFWPSLDRIDSSLGYVRGNIWVISQLANRMKSNATPELILTFCEGAQRMYGVAY